MPITEFFKPKPKAKRSGESEPIGETRSAIQKSAPGLQHGEGKGADIGPEFWEWEGGRSGEAFAVFEEDIRKIDIDLKHIEPTRRSARLQTVVDEFPGQHDKWELQAEDQQAILEFLPAY